MDDGAAELLELAIELARGAGRLSLRDFGQAAHHLEIKKNSTPVTETDRVVEQWLRDQLRRLRPRDSVSGEEYPDSPGTSRTKWILDPIDGTLAFVSGVPLYSNLIAVAHDNEPIIGVLNFPALESMMWSSLGHGTFRDDRRVSVSNITDISESTITTSTYEQWTSDLFGAVKGTKATMCGWGDAFGYYLVASGAVEAMIDPSASKFDTTPMKVVIAEAGGTLREFQGGGAFASNQLIAEDLTAVFRGVGLRTVE